MSASTELRVVTAHLANGQADAWPVKINGVNLVLMTEAKFRALVESAGAEVRGL